MVINIRCENIFMARGLREGLAQIADHCAPAVPLDIVCVPGDSLSFIDWMARFCIREKDNPTVLLATGDQIRILTGLVDPRRVCLMDSRSSLREVLDESLRFARCVRKQIAVPARPGTGVPRVHMSRYLSEMECILIGMNDRRRRKPKSESARKIRIRMHTGIRTDGEAFVKCLVHREINRIREASRVYLVRHQQVRVKTQLLNVDLFCAER